MCCEEDSIICDIIGAIAACCFCYWWNVIPNEKPKEQKRRRIQSVSGVQSSNVSECIEHNIIVKQLQPHPQSKYILPVDFPSQHGNNSPKKHISDIYDNIGPLSNLNMKLAKSQMRSEKFDKINESPRQFAVKNSDNFILTKDNGEYKVATI